MSLKKRFALAALALLCAQSARAYRPPKNPHFGKKRAAAGAAVAASTAPAVPAGVVPIDRLKPGRWDPKVRLALEIFAADNGKDSERYDPDNPPVAVLAWDDAAVDGDVGEQIFQRLIDRAEFKDMREGDDWWNLVPLAYGRQRIRAAYEQFKDLPRSTWSAQPTYRQYRKYMVQSYQDSCRKVSRKDCRLYLARLFKGFSQDELIAYAADVIAEAKSSTMTVERVGASEDDPAPVAVRRGLRDVPEVKDLCRLLFAAGIDVWVSELEPEEILDAAVPGFGVNASFQAQTSRVLGIRQAHFRDRLTSKIEEPVPYRDGKVDAVLARVGRAPALVIGASSNDEALMDYGTGLRLLLDSGDKVLRARAKTRGWLVQPSFSSSPSLAAPSLIPSP